MNDAYNLFLELSNKFTPNQLAEFLGVNRGTVLRWIDKKEVPSQYYFDLCRVANINVDYSNYSFKEKDQFFTHKSTAIYCYNKTIEILNNFNVNIEEYTFIEPSVGEGSFYNLLPKNKRIGVDIEPRCEGTFKHNFLDWYPKTDKNICIGNPPFGLRGNLALKFINHAEQFSDFICFILPQLFNSSGKGSCKSRVKGLNLIHNEIINSSFYYPDGEEVFVNVVFQILSKHFKIEEFTINLDNIIKLYSLSDGGTPGSTRNKKHLYSCDYYLPSTCFGENNIKIYSKFEDLPHRRGYGVISLIEKSILDKIMSSINWSSVSFRSTNGAYNLRFDLIKKEIWRLIPEKYKNKTCIYNSYDLKQ